MQVKDLIEKLQKLPPDAHVVQSHYSENEYHFYGEETLINLMDAELFPAYILCERIKGMPTEFIKEKQKHGTDKKTDVVILKF